MLVCWSAPESRNALPCKLEACASSHGLQPPKRNFAQGADRPPDHDHNTPSCDVYSHRRSWEDYHIRRALAAVRDMARHHAIHKGRVLWLSFVQRAIKVKDCGTRDAPGPGAPRRAS